MEEGDEVREGAGVEVGREEEEEQLHFLVRLLWEALELQVCVLRGHHKREKDSNIRSSFP